MPYKTKIGEFIAINWKWLIMAVGVSFISWGAYVLERGQIETNKRRLQNFRDEQKNDQKEIDQLQIDVEVLKALLKNCVGDV